MYQLPASPGLTNFKNFMHGKDYRISDPGRKYFAYHCEILLNSAAIGVLSTVQDVVCSLSACPELPSVTGF